MSSFRAPRVLTVTAALLFLCLGFLVGESLVADACDGDAGAAPAGSAWVAQGAAASAPGDAGMPAGGRPPAPEHGMHVDHCVHPHAGGPVAHQVTLTLAALPPIDLRASAMLAPPDPAPQRSIRPPIA